jgi:hypothetical protein
MKILLLLILILSLVCVFVTCRNKILVENIELKKEIYIGKHFTISVSENEIIDANYLQNVLDGKIRKDVPYFDLWNNNELKKLIDYMKCNNFIIAPGEYRFNQGWQFKDGIFFYWNGKEFDEFDVFKFENK